MALKFISELEISESSISYTIVDDNSVLVGSAEGYVNEQGELISVIKIENAYQGLGYGFQAFKKIFHEFNEKIKINKIVGSWHVDEEFSCFEKSMSTNLKIFLECLNKTSDTERCAFKTPTGKWAIKLGFNQCKILRVENDHVLVEFFK